MKTKIFVILVLLVMFLTGCSNQEIQPTNNNSNSNAITNSSSSDEQSIKNYEKNIEPQITLNNVLGSKDNPFIITNIDDLVNAFTKTTKNNYYKLSNDITYTSHYSMESFDSFDGFFDGDNHKLINFMVNGGLFKKVSGTIENLVIEKSSASAYNKGADIKCGMLANELLTGATINNSKIIDCNVHASASTYKESEGVDINAYIGGLVGYMHNKSNIYNCDVKNLDGCCHLEYHDKGWQVDPISEAPHSYFGGLVGAVGGKCIIRNNFVQDVKCLADNTVRVSCLFGPDIYSIMSLAGFIGYVSNLDSIIQDNQIFIDKDKFIANLYYRNDAFLNLIGNKKNWCLITENIGNIYGTLKSGVDSATGRKFYV